MLFKKTLLMLSIFTVTTQLWANLELNNIYETSEEEPQVWISEFKYNGNTVFTDAQINEFIFDDYPANFSLKKLKSIAAKIEEKYKEAGYEIAKVIIPQQDFLANQPVELLILEGKLGQVKVVGNVNYQSKFITQSLSASEVVSGKAFRLDHLENTLMKINRHAGVTVKSVLSAGDELGYTDIQIHVEEEPRVTTVLEVNNYGSESTGEYRFIPQVDVTNLTGRGDKLSFVAMHTLDGEGSYYAHIAYNTPIGVIGSKVGTYVTVGNVKVGEQLAPLDIQGNNQAFGLGFQHDFIIDPTKLYQAEMWLEGYDIDQTILGEQISEDKIRKLRVGINHEVQKNTSRSIYATHVHQGLGRLLGGGSVGNVIQNPNSFTKFTFDYTRLQRLSDRTTLIPRLSAQLAFDSLVSGEQFSLGGYNSVIGHAPSAYSGDSGYNLNLETRYLLSDTSTKYQFATRLDFGQIFRKDPAVGQSSSDQLVGASVGILANLNKYIDLRLDYGRPLDDVTGKDDYIFFQTRFTF